MSKKLHYSNVCNIKILIFFPAHGHMLQKTVGSDGSVILVAYLSFPNECEFVVMRMHDGGSGGVRFSHISRIFGPQVRTYFTNIVYFILYYLLIFYYLIIFYLSQYYIYYYFCSWISLIMLLVMEMEAMSFGLCGVNRMAIL